MRRVCFTARIRPDRLEEYRARHQQVWPEMLEVLHSSGWHNYSLFLTPDGLLIGYLETEDFAAAQAAMDATEVNARWQAEMAEYFVRPGPFVSHEEVFNLADQRERAGLP
ncbi:MAG TPA: L-rhamnose mutarotase [Jiangellaceae bacterium]|nr:L-rhamnose mutarotase [Jiangellaceae bacterium]